jgi:5-methylcytosine-specific restriction endonuclease McrA
MICARHEDFLRLLFLPLAWLMRGLSSRRRASPKDIRLLSLEGVKALLMKEPRCKPCGAPAAAGARMNVDHVEPLHRHWHLELAASNLQTLCASGNWGKGGR